MTKAQSTMSLIQQRQIIFEQASLTNNKKIVNVEQQRKLDRTMICAKNMKLLY